MKEKVLLLLKIIGVITAVIFTLIATLYISNLFSAEYVRYLGERIIIVIGILAVVSLAIIYLTDKQEKNK